MTLQQLIISTITFVLIAGIPCLLAEERSVPPGAYGDEEWQANPTYNLNTASYWALVGKPISTNEQCTQEVSFGGRTTFDSVKIPCSTIPVVYADKEELMVGNAIYATTTGKAVIVSPDHTCVERTYILDPSNTRMSPRKKLTAPECLDVRRDMKDALMDIVSQQLGGERHPMWNKFLKKLQQEYGDLDSNSNEGTGSNNIDMSQIGLNGASSGLTKFASSPYVQEDGNLVRKVKVGGSGVNYECVLLERENTGLLNIGQYNLLGNVIFNEEYGKLIVFSGQNCFLKDFTKGNPSSVQLSAQKCQEVQTKMRQMNGHSNYIRGVISDSTSSGSTSTGVVAQKPNNFGGSNGVIAQSPVVNQQLEFTNAIGSLSIDVYKPYTSADGRSVRMVTVTVPGAAQGDSFEIDSSANTGISNMDIGTFIGDCFYSDSYGTLVVLSGDRCLLKTYSGNGPSKTVIMSSGKCQAIRRQMMNLRGRVGSATSLSVENNQFPQPLNQKPQVNQGLQNTQQLGQIPQVNQRPQNLPGVQQLGQMPQVNQGPQNIPVTQQLGQMTQVNQGPQNVPGAQQLGLMPQNIPVAQQLGQMPQVNQGPQNIPVTQQLGQMPQVNQGPQNVPGAQQLGQVPQVDQGPQNFPVVPQQNNQQPQENRIVQLLNKVTESLSRVVDWLIQKLGIKQ